MLDTIAIGIIAEPLPAILCAGLIATIGAISLACAWVMDPRAKTKRERRRRQSRDRKARAKHLARRRQHRFTRA